MFSIDTETGLPSVAVINAAWGLGESVVQGMVDPDKYLVFKPHLSDPSLRPIIEKTLGAKERKVVYATGGSARTAIVDTDWRERRSFVLSDDEILEARALGGRGGAALRPPDGHGMGEGRGDGRASTWSRPAPKRCSRPIGRRCSGPTG